MLERKARGKDPSTMRSSPRSNPRMATTPQVTGGGPGLSGGLVSRWEPTRDRAIFHVLSLGRVAELADALASGASGRKVVGVQVPPRPPTAPTSRCWAPADRLRVPKGRTDDPPVGAWLRALCRRRRRDCRSGRADRR